MKKISLLFILIWLVVIFFMSNEPAIKSVERTNIITDTSVSVFNEITGKNLNTAKINNIISNNFKINMLILVRKSAHFIEFFILGILTFNVLIKFFKFGKKHMIISLLLCFTYACLDEFHQLFVSGRTARILDVLIDTSGSLLGILCFGFVYWLFKIRHSSTFNDINNNQQIGE